MVGYIQRGEVYAVVAATWRVADFHAARGAFTAKSHVGAMVVEIPGGLVAGHPSGRRRCQHRGRRPRGEGSADGWVVGVERGVEVQVLPE